MLLLTGCWDRKEIEDMGFVMAIGLDPAPGGKVAVTFQVAIPRAIVNASGGSGGQAGPNTPPVLVERMEGKTVFEAVRDLEQFTNRRISLVQLRLVVFGSDLAEQGLAEHIGVLVRNRQVRQTVMVMVADSKAEEVLELNPAMEKDPSLYLQDLTRRAYERTARAPRVNLHDFLVAYETLDHEPMAPLVHRRITTPGLTGVKRDTKPELSGTAVFRRDKMVCRLSPEETEMILMMTGRSRAFVQNITPPGSPETLMTVEMSAASRRVRVDLSGPQPVFTVHVVTEGEIREAERLPPAMVTPQALGDLGHAAGDQIRQRAAAAIQRLQQECRSDLLGLGRVMRVRFIDHPSWVAYKWPDHFPKSKVTVEVETHIRRMGLTLQNATPPY